MLEIELQKSDCLKEVRKLKQMFKTYSEKLTIQMEKVAECFEDKEPEFVEQIIDEDCQLNFEVGEFLIELDELCASMDSTSIFYGHGDTDSVPTKTDRLTNLHDQMQEVMNSQMEQQIDLFAHIERKENKHQSSAVKLSKFEQHKFNGNKLK